MSLTGGKQRSEMPKEKDEIMASPVISTMVAGKVQIRGCEKTFTCSYTVLGSNNRDLQGLWNYPESLLVPNFPDNSNPL